MLSLSKQSAFPVHPTTSSGRTEKVNRYRKLKIFQCGVLTRCFWVSMLLVIAWPAMAITTDDFLVRNTRPDGTGTPYRVFVSPGYREGQRLPVLVFLNGSGEIGADNEVQLDDNTDGLFNRLLSPEHLAQQPLLLVAPQSRWLNWDPAEIAEVVASVQAEYGNDPERVYLTGLSSGGSAVWESLKAFPDLFAAGVPICAATSIYGLKRIARIPVWVFHGAQDHETDPDKGDGGRRKGPRTIVAKLRAYGANPKYTEYPDLGHKVWDRVYAQPQLFYWLMAQRRGLPMQPASIRQNR